MTVLLVGFLSSSANAAWPIYHEPEFNGQILDIDTKEPIEGAVVVVEYKKESMGMGAGHESSVIKVRETLTDKDGKFHIPSYTTTLLLPFTWQDHSIFIIYKPGYASIQLALNDYFTGKDMSEQVGSWPDQDLRMLKYRLRCPGIVELPKLQTREQRLRARRIYIVDYNSKELPLLYKSLGEEGKALGVE